MTLVTVSLVILRGGLGLWTGNVRGSVIYLAGESSLIPGIEVLKCKEGMNNKAFLLQWIMDQWYLQSYPMHVQGLPFTQQHQKLPPVLS